MYIEIKNRLDFRWDQIPQTKEALKKEQPDNRQNLTPEDMKKLVRLKMRGRWDKDWKDKIMSKLRTVRESTYQESPSSDLDRKVPGHYWQT